MKNIVLTGFMGCGKTTVGQIVAKKMGCKFIDADSYVEDKAGMKISDIFARFGEDYFRELEAACIAELADIKNCVIATGGGAVLRPDNLRLLRKNGIIIYLDAQLDTILKHTKGSDARPLINGQSEQQVRERYLTRLPYYADCDCTVKVDGLSPLEIAIKVLGCCKK